MENRKITIYTNENDRVFYSQNKEESYTAYEVEQLPKIPPRELYDGYLIYDGSVFTFGYALSENKCYARINDLKAQITATDYVLMKEMEGEDVGKYGEYKAGRNACRVEINRIEGLIAQR